jgi:hypothetical protein
VGSRLGLDAVEKRKFLPLLGVQTQIKIPKRVLWVVVKA